MKVGQYHPSAPKLIEEYIMKHKVPNVKFKVRELGEWVTKTSDDFFKGKRVVVFGLLVRLHQLVQVNNYQVMKVNITNSKKKALTKFIVCQLMILLL